MHAHPSSDIAFTAAVKAMQTQRHARAHAERIEARGGFRTEVNEDLIGFLAEVDTAFLATATAEGQPYAQHRGGPKGFIRPLAGNRLGWADFRGNRQYVTLGNLSENDRAFLILMDYAHRRRVKLWGRARVTQDADIIAQLMPAEYRAQPEQAILFDVTAWDINCPQHIPQKFDADDVNALVQTLLGRLATAEAELAGLRARLASLATQTGASA